MDRMTLWGLFIGFIAIVSALIIEDAQLKSLFSLQAFIIVFGGTTGATIIGYSWDEIRQIPDLIRATMLETVDASDDLIATMVIYSESARRDGLLSLEDGILYIEDPFLHKGMQLLIDGTDSDLLRDILETELFYRKENQLRLVSIFESAGGYAPTMGIIGTVLGLVNVLGNLNNAEALGPSIATAFIATFYGVASANLLFLPLAAKLRAIGRKQEHQYEIILEGILAIQAGDNPRMMKEKLLSFLP